MTRFTIGVRGEGSLEGVSSEALGFICGHLNYLVPRCPLCMKRALKQVQVISAQGLPYATVQGKGILIICTVHGYLMGTLSTLQMEALETSLHTDPEAPSKMHLKAMGIPWPSPRRRVLYQTGPQDDEKRP